MMSLSVRPAALMTKAAALFSRAPFRLRVELTNHCNLRCKMCGIWSEMPKRTLTPDFYEQVLSSPVLSHLRVISLTGGEPFMLPELDTYYRLARALRPAAHVNVSSNGF